MVNKHLSSQFDNELSVISNRVLEMGGLVEAQVAQAVNALVEFNGGTAALVLRQENQVNQMELDIDPDLVERCVTPSAKSKHERSASADSTNDSPLGAGKCNVRGHQTPASQLRRWRIRRGVRRVGPPTRPPVAAARAPRASARCRP